MEEATTSALSKVPMRLDLEVLMKNLIRDLSGAMRDVLGLDDRTVFGNAACPVAGSVIGRAAICMTTSNVFGAIAAENLGNPRLVLQETIAGGASAGRVVVNLDSLFSGMDRTGRESFRSEA